MIEDGHITLEEVSAVFGEKKQNGYIAKNPDILPEVKKRVDELYQKFYPSNDKVTNSDYGHQLCWDVVAERKVVKVCWAVLGLKVAKEKARRDKNIGLGEDGHKVIKQEPGVPKDANPKVKSDSGDGCASPNPSKGVIGA